MSAASIVPIENPSVNTNVNIREKELTPEQQQAVTELRKKATQLLEPKERAALRARNVLSPAIASHWSHTLYGIDAAAQQQYQSDCEKDNQTYLTPKTEAEEKATKWCGTKAVYSNTGGGAYRLSNMETTDPATWTDRLLARFLAARKWKVEPAAEMFVNYITWREDYGVNTLAKRVPMPYEPLVNTILAHSYHGYDKHGRPMYIQKTGLCNPSRFVKEIPNEQLAITHVWFQEEIQRRMEVSSQLKGERVNNLVMIVDAKNIGLAHRKTLKFFKITSYIDQWFYPETLGCIYFINAPSFFPVLWSICKAFLDPVVQSKIKILGKDPGPTLCADLGAECVPVEFGGQCSCTGGCVPPQRVGHERRASSIAADGQDDIEEDDIKVKARTSQDVIFGVAPASEIGGTVTVHWEFSIAAKNIQFHVEFQPDGGSSTIVYPMKKHESSEGMIKGSYSPPSDAVGNVRLVWDNSFSWTASKQVKYKAWVHVEKSAQQEQNELQAAIEAGKQAIKEQEEEEAKTQA